MSVAAGAGTFIGVMVLPFQDASRGFLDPGLDWAEPPATQDLDPDYLGKTTPEQLSDASDAQLKFLGFFFTRAEASNIAVQNDLLAIARAERQYMAANGSYASLDDLVSGHYLTINGARPPYSYQVDTSAEGFRATASRS